MGRSREDVERDIGLVDKRFGHVDGVLWFNRHGHGPFSADICVRANVHPSRNYPNSRISFGQWGAEPKEMDFGGVILTVAQAIEVVKMFKAAIKEVVTACPALAVEVPFEDLDG